MSFKRPIAPALGKTIEFQILDIEEKAITHDHGCTGGEPPGDWSWLAEQDRVEMHLGGYSKSKIPEARQNVAVVLYGTTPGGESVACWVRYRRTFRVEVHHSVDIAGLVENVRMLTFTKKKIDYAVERLPRRYGWKSSKDDNRMPKLYTTIVVSASTKKRYDELVWAFKNQEREPEGTVVEIHEEVRRVGTNLKFVIESGANYGSWVKIERFTPRDTRFMTSDYEIVVDDISHISVDHERLETAPWNIAAIDIECDSPSGRFPNPENDTDAIIMIGIIHRHPLLGERKMLFRLPRFEEEGGGEDVVADAPELDGYHELIFETENDLLMALRNFIVILDVRVLVTFNGDKFDWKYILRRAKNAGIDMQFFTTLGQHLVEPWRESKVGFGRDAEFVDPVVASTEKNASVVFDLPGRVGIDLRFLFQKTMNGVGRYRFKRYSLNAVANRLVGASKLDVPASEMFRIWKEGTPVELRYFCDYCVVDVKLLFDIIDKELIMEQLMAMATTNSTSPHGIVNLGSFRKVDNATTINAAKLGLFTNNDHRLKKVDMKGAKVVDPVCGPHGTPNGAYDEPTDRFIDVAELDDDVRGLVEEVLSKDELRIYKSKGKVGTLDFASLYPSIMMSYVLCVFTIILGREGDSRVEKHYSEKDVTEEGLEIHEETIWVDDDPAKGVLRVHRFVQNAREPYRNGILPKWEAELKATRKRFKRMMKEKPELRDVYDARQLATKIAMNSVYGVVFLFCAKIAESITNRGRLMLNSVIKEVTSMGYQVVYGDSVAKDTPIWIKRNGRVEIVEIGDLGGGWEPYGNKEQCELMGVEVLDEGGWTTVRRVIRHKTDKRMFRVTTSDGTVDCTEDHSLLDETKTEVRPKDISVGGALLHRKSLPLVLDERSARVVGSYIATTLPLVKNTDRFSRLVPFTKEITTTLERFGVDVMRAFFDGLCDVTVPGKVYSKVEWSVITAFCEETGIFGIGDNIIFSVNRIPNISGIVYDLETDSGHFHVGPGRLVVHNTDSVMVKHYFDNDEEGFAFFKDLERQLNEKLFSGENDVNALEFEKYAEWFLLMGRKAYFMKKKETFEEDYKLGSTGTCDVRRDRPAILTDITVLMGKIMSSCSHLDIRATGKVVLEALFRHFEGIVDNTHDISKYTVTTTIQTVNENTEKKAHMVLARRLEERDGVSFTIGDSIDVVQVVGKHGTPDAENVAAPADLEADPRGKERVDRFLYFKKKLIDQTVKMAKWYIPPPTMELIIREYTGVLERKKNTPKSKSLLTMWGGREGTQKKKILRIVRKTHI